MEKISLLMSLYDKERPEYFEECLDSVFKQTRLPDEIVMVLDGPINSALQSVLDRYNEQNPNLFNIIRLKENMGLGIALAAGVKACSYRLVARMDTDDIMVSDRLEKQICLFQQKPKLAIVGSNIIEFEASPENVIGRRNVPELNEEINKFSKKRNPFNHMTVMFDRNAVLTVGNYQPLQGFEDYYLWVRLLKKGYESFNIQEPLVLARAGRDMYARRGGLKYIHQGIKARYKIYTAGQGSMIDFAVGVAGNIVIGLAPNKLRGKFYEKKLRN